MRQETVSVNCAIVVAKGSPHVPLNTLSYVKSASLNTCFPCYYFSMSEVRIQEVYTDTTHDKISRDEAISSIRRDVISKLLGELMLILL